MGYLFALFSLSKSATETALNVSELTILAAGLLLAFGATGEYLEEHNRLPCWMAWPKLVFILIVVTSLIGEFLGDAGVYVFSSELQSISDRELEAEKAARVRLEKEVVWRNLLPKDAEAIRKAVPRSLAALRIDVYHILVDPEASTYAGEIASALKPALKVNATGYLGAWSTIPQGVVIYAERLDMPGLDDIQRALKAGGIDAPKAVLSDAGVSVSSGISIFVWPKPSPQAK
jgi:hypothetical protein